MDIGLLTMTGIEHDNNFMKPFEYSTTTERSLAKTGACNSFTGLQMC
jgi:hypothetical protein